MIRITSLRVGCGYVYVQWISRNSKICKIRRAAVRLQDFDYEYRYTSIAYTNYTKITGVPSNTLLNVSIFVTTTNTLYLGRSPSVSTLVTTMYMQRTFKYVCIFVYMHACFMLLVRNKS